MTCTLHATPRHRARGSRGRGYRHPSSSSSSSSSSKLLKTPQGEVRAVFPSFQVVPVLGQHKSIPVPLRSQRLLHLLRLPPPPPSSSFLLSSSARAARKESVAASTAAPASVAATKRGAFTEECRRLRSLLCGPGSAKMPGRALSVGSFCRQGFVRLESLHLRGPGGSRVATRCAPCRTSGAQPLPGPHQSTAAHVATTSAVVAPSLSSSCHTLKGNLE